MSTSLTVEFSSHKNFITFDNDLEVGVFSQHKISRVGTKIGKQS
jgi:hypothetical protein